MQDQGASLLPNKLMLILFSAAYANTQQIPLWVTNSKLEDSSYHYVVCSHDGLDPEEIKLTAEGKCYASAAKLGGVNVSIKQKGIQSLSGSDFAEVAEIQPLDKFVKCDFTDRYLDTLSTGFRLWLRCRIPKSSLVTAQVSDKRDITEGHSLASIKTSKYKRATLYVTAVPQPEKIIVSGERGDRVVEVSTNPQQVELREGDSKITVKKHKYRPVVLELGNWPHAGSMSKTVYLEQEF